MRQGLFLLALVLLAGTTGIAQQPSFRTDINFVEVHAVVTDERGRFVADLSPDDFEIFEDGRLQKPSVFDLVDVPSPAPVAISGARDIESDVRSSTPSFAGRIFIFVLDDLHTTTVRSPHVRAAAKQFVDEHLGPNDLAAVVFTSGRQEAAQELTSSHRLLRAAFDRFQGQKLPSASIERLGVHLREREMESSAADSAGDGTSSSRARGSAQRADDPLDAERGFTARRSLETVRDVAQWLTNVEGRRKALVLFSEGIDYDIYDVFNNRSASAVIHDAREAIVAAQRANVSIYPVDPRGLTQMGDQAIEVASLSPDANVHYGSPNDLQRELLLSQESLMWLADETGGMALVRSNDIRGGLRRIADDNSRYYLLGYTSDRTSGGGKFRSIKVHVKRPGLKVRARRGYEPADRKSAAKRQGVDVKEGTSPALATALASPLPVGDLPVRVFAAPFKDSGKGASVLVAVEMDGSALKFDQRDDRFTNTLEFAVIAADHTGNVRGSDRQELNLKLKPETRNRVIAGGVRVLSRLNLPPARYQIRVGVHESVGGALAMVPYDLVIPDYSKATFELSGVTLASSSAASLMTPAPDAQLKQVFPVPPVATRTFGRDEQLGVFVELYDASELAHIVDFTTTVTPLDGDDLRPRYSAQESRTLESGAGIRTHGFRTDVPLRDLGPGRYVLRIEATSRSDERTVKREVPFEVRDTTSVTTF